MKTVILLVLMIGSVAQADTWVNGYMKRDGTYVQGYYRTSADHNIYNNYSTKGNVNPYTGHTGTVDPYQQIFDNAINDNDDDSFGY